MHSQIGIQRTDTNRYTSTVINLNLVHCTIRLVRVQLHRVVCLFLLSCRSCLLSVCSFLWVHVHCECMAAGSKQPGEAIDNDPMCGAHTCGNSQPQKRCKGSWHRSRHASKRLQKPWHYLTALPISGVNPLGFAFCRPSLCKIAFAQR